jgi:pyruvate kinase
MIEAIVTLPPYAPFRKEVYAHPLVKGVRLNVVMPVKNIDEVVQRLSDETSALDKELWIDLKTRQLRVEGYWTPPFTEVALSHSISVNTPVTAYFNDGKDTAKILEVDGNRLIFQDGPRRVIGPGESINIPDDSLVIDGYFTDTDKRYIEASQKAKNHRYMLSYVEQPSDVNALYALDNRAIPIAKIESKKGLSYVQNQYNGVRLMAARGDLFVELDRPHHIIKAIEDIVRVDNNAIAASRILSSLSKSYEPSCADISDVDNLLRIGYRSFMLGDDICMERDSAIGALNVLAAVSEKYNGGKK